MTKITDLTVRAADGSDLPLSRYAGQVLLIVNTASRCGFTPHYDGLEALHAKYHDEGLAVLGFPADDFGGQEPGDDAEIAAFCAARGVTFPMFAKVAAAGPDRHPLFTALVAALPEAQGGDALRRRLAERGLGAAPAPDILWNFEKFLVGRDGTPVARFASDVAPDDAMLVRAVERELFASE